MEVVIARSPEAAAEYAARLVATLLDEAPAAVLGLAAGRTMEPVYAAISAAHEAGHLDLSRVTAFLLDEYAGISPEHPASFEGFAQRHLLSRAGVPPERVHAPRGSGAGIPEACAAYERAILDAGGIDLQILGLGVDGHVGFNEPGSSLSSRTRLKTITAATARRAAALFGSEAAVPRHVLTMGIATILASRTALLVAFGEEKAAAAAAALEGPLTASVPASALQLHPRAIALLDEAAASRLLRAAYARAVFERKPGWQMPRELHRGPATG